MEELKQLLFNDWVYTLIVLSTCTFYLLIAYGIYRCFRKPKTIEPKASMPSLQQLEELYGAPSDAIALSPTKCNQADSVILVYEDAGFLVVNGNKVLMSDVASVTFNNSSIPWESPEYQILIQTPASIIRLFVGYDSEWAKSVTVQIRSCLPDNVR